MSCDPHIPEFVELKKKLVDLDIRSKQKLRCKKLMHGPGINLNPTFKEERIL